MRKILALLLMLLFVFSATVLSGCDSKEENNSVASKTADSSQSGNGESSEQKEEQASIIGKWKYGSDFSLSVKSSFCDSYLYSSWFEDGESVDEYFKGYNFTVFRYAEFKTDGTLTMSSDGDLKAKFDKATNDLAEIMLEMCCDYYELVPEELVGVFLGAESLQDIKDYMLEEAEYIVGVYDTEDDAVEDTVGCYELDGKTLYMADTKSDLKYHKDECSSVSVQITQTKLTLMNEDRQVMVYTRVSE